MTALVGALGVALGEMAVQYSINKKGLEAYADELKPAVAELTRARGVLLQLMVEDQAAYDAMTAARKLPADAPGKKDQQAAALLTCIRVPEAIAATSVAVLEICDRLVGFVNPYLLSDLAVSADLSMATIRCAIYSVRSNLGLLEDPNDRRSVEAAISQLLGRALVLIQSVAPRIWDRIKQGT